MPHVLMLKYLRTFKKIGNIHFHRSRTSLTMATLQNQNHCLLTLNFPLVTFQRHGVAGPTRNCLGGSNSCYLMFSHKYTQPERIIRDIESRHRTSMIKPKKKTHHEIYEKTRLTRLNLGIGSQGAPRWQLESEGAQHQGLGPYFDSESETWNAWNFWCFWCFWCCVLIWNDVKLRFWWFWQVLRAMELNGCHWAPADIVVFSSQAKHIGTFSVDLLTVTSDLDKCFDSNECALPQGTKGI